MTAVCRCCRSWLKRFRSRSRSASSEVLCTTAPNRPTIEIPATPAGRQTSMWSRRQSLPLAEKRPLMRVMRSNRCTSFSEAKKRSRSSGCTSKIGGLPTSCSGSACSVSSTGPTISRMSPAPSSAKKTEPVAAKAASSHEASGGSSAKAFWSEVLFMASQALRRRVVKGHQTTNLMRGSRAKRADMCWLPWSPVCTCAKRLHASVQKVSLS